MLVNPIQNLIQTENILRFKSGQPLDCLTLMLSVLCTDCDSNDLMDTIFLPEKTNKVDFFYKRPAGFSHQTIIFF